MKNYFLMAGATVLLVAGCAMEKVTEVSGNREITFEQFVNNGTKAVTELTTEKLNQYYVFGEFGDSDGTYGTKIFNNELQTTAYYWVASKHYSFGAYADGDKGKIENAAFDASNGVLTFKNYNVDDTKDLVAAVTKVETNEDVTGANPVDLTFKHLLSQVKFTFTTKDADSYILSISDLKFTAATSGNCKFDGTPTWTLVPGGEYLYDNITDVSSPEYKYKAQSKLVIPQNNTNTLKVTFTARITGAGLDKTANFESTLAVAENSAGTSEANTWMPGYRYNYTAEINADKIDPSLENQKIEFTPTVEGWTDAKDSETNPATPVIP